LAEVKIVATRYHVAADRAVAAQTSSWNLG